jgi:LPS sulfotransferase NodH
MQGITSSGTVSTLKDISTSAMDDLQVYPSNKSIQEFRCLSGPVPWANAYDLSGEDYDYPKYGRPNLIYVVATTRRSGSTYFCHSLWQTGLLGAPMEYFSLQHVMLDLGARLKAYNPYDYLNAIIAHRTSPNGVFGIKLMPDHMAQMRALSIVVRSPNMIYLQRRDVVAQAVSYVKAMQTRKWNTMYPDTNHKPVYKYEAIQRAINMIKAEGKFWDDWFNHCGVIPTHVYYEDFVSQPNRVLKDLLDRFGIVEDDSKRIQMPKIEKQSDEINKQWIIRFREEAGREIF